MGPDLSRSPGPFSGIPRAQETPHTWEAGHKCTEGVRQPSTNAEQVRIRKGDALSVLLPEILVEFALVVFISLTPCRGNVHQCLKARQRTRVSGAQESIQSHYRGALGRGQWRQVRQVGADRELVPVHQLI